MADINIFMGKEQTIGGGVLSPISEGEVSARIGLRFGPDTVTVFLSEYALSDSESIESLLEKLSDMKREITLVEERYGQILPLVKTREERRRQREERRKQQESAK